MKKLFLLITFCLLNLLSPSIQAHGAGENRVSLQAKIPGALKAGAIHYEFQLIDTQSQKNISDRDLVETHTKILHMIVYDASKNIFNHVHPEFDGQFWTTDLNLPADGTYFLWAQGELQDGTEFSALTKTQVQGGTAEIPVLDLGDHRKATDGLTTLQLDASKLRAGKMAMLNYKVTREDHQDPQISPYLGAVAHVIAVSADGNELIHVHPMEGADASTGMIHATFPVAGDYRIWVQLMDHNELKTIPLSVTVGK